MGQKGLPKKYAKMGFKKGWREWKKTAGWRKSHGLKGGTKAKTTGKSPKKTSSSRRSSTRRSNPGGGASTSVAERMGALWKKIRTMANILAPGAREFSPWRPSFDIGTKLYNVVMNYTGYNAATGGWQWQSAAPSWQGIGTSIVNDWFDRKTRKAAKISKGKLVHIISEGIPALQAHIASSGTGSMYAWNFYNVYNKRTTGYQMSDHTWDLSRVNLYAGAKVGAWAYDKIMPSNFKRMLNNAFPKGVNPF